MLWGGRQGHGNFVAACDLTVPARASETVTPFPFPGEAWMLWKECSVMDERLRFVARLLDGEAMSEVCRAFGISRKTGYKIFDRYKEHGLEVLLVFLRLGLTSFGGPVAHLGYFRVEFVERRKWLDEAAYVDIVALCQFLPGPASSQTGISIGILRAGIPGALCAWLGFTAPSALAMILFGYGVTAFGNLADAAWLH